MAKSPSDPFDPCREWLGIDRADLADPRRVLGLLPSETDPLVVLRASEARLSLLKGLAAGPHHAAREGLILRVEQARESVLSQIAAAGATGRPAARGAAPGAGFAMPPPPRRPASAGSDDGATVLFADAADAGRDAPAPSAPAVRIRPSRPLRRRDNSAAIWGSVVAMLASVAAGVGFIWWQSQQQERRLATKEPARPDVKQDAEMDAEVGTGRVAADRKRPGRVKPLPEDMAISSSPPPASTPRPRPSPKPVRGDDAPPLATAAVTRPVEPDPSRDADPMPSDEPMAALPTAGEPVGAEPVPTPDDGGDDLPMTEDPPADESPDDAAVEAEIAAALRALREEDFDTADALLASALEGAQGIPAKQRIADWKVLAEYAREFTGFRDKALQEVKPGNEFDVNGKKVAVVEIDGKKFIYRFQGRNKTVPRDKIPAGILLAIVTTWFDERPANQLFLGAHHATKPEADLARAKSHWELAEKGGINAAPLLGLLDDPVLADAPAGKSTRAADD